MTWRTTSEALIDADMGLEPGTAIRASLVERASGSCVENLPSLAGERRVARLTKAYGRPSIFMHAIGRACLPAHRLAVQHHHHIADRADHETPDAAPQPPIRSCSKSQNAREPLPAPPPPRTARPVGGSRSALQRGSTDGFPPLPHGFGRSASIQVHSSSFSSAA